MSCYEFWKEQEFPCTGVPLIIKTSITGIGHLCYNALFFSIAIKTVAVTRKLRWLLSVALWNVFSTFLFLPTFWPKSWLKIALYPGLLSFNQQHLFSYLNMPGDKRLKKFRLFSLLFQILRRILWKTEAAVSVLPLSAEDRAMSLNYIH